MKLDFGELIKSRIWILYSNILKQPQTEQITNIA